jgi:hypothetical protein
MISGGTIWSRNGHQKKGSVPFKPRGDLREGSRVSGRDLSECKGITGETPVSVRLQLMRSASLDLTSASFDASRWN